MLASASHRPMWRWSIGAWTGTDEFDTEWHLL